MTFNEFKKGLTTNWEKQVRKNFTPEMAEMIISSGPDYNFEELYKQTI